jgi:hypothetical protein
MAFSRLSVSSNGSLRSRAFHSSPASSASSPLFALQALANSRETQHFNKTSGLSRVNHSPNLELLRSSEVDPFRRKQPPPTPTHSAPDSKPLSIEQQREKVKNDAVPKVIPNALASNPLIPNVDRTSATQGQATRLNAAKTTSHAHPTPREADRESLRDALTRLEARHERLQSAWRNERKMLTQERNEFRRRADNDGSLSYLLLISAVIAGGVAVASYYQVGIHEVREAALGTDKEAMWNTAAKAMSGTKKEAYSALQQGSAATTTAVGEPEVPAKSKSGWFWR